MVLQAGSLASKLCLIRILWTLSRYRKRNLEHLVHLSQCAIRELSSYPKVPTPEVPNPDQLSVPSLRIASTMSKIEAIIRAQHEVHHRISRVIDNLKKLGKDKITPLVLDTQLTALESYWKSFHASHSVLVVMQTEEFKSLDYFANDYYELYETSYFAIKDELRQLHKEMIAKEDTSIDHPLDVFAFSAPQPSRTQALPKISLPKFNGD